MTDERSDIERWLTVPALSPAAAAVHALSCAAMVCDEHLPSSNISDQIRDALDGMWERLSEEDRAALNGQHTRRPSDESLKHALTLFADLSMMGMNGTARLAMAAERRLNEADERWSLNPWVLGFQAGQAATDQRYQQAASHLANALRMKAGS